MNELDITEILREPLLNSLVYPKPVLYTTQPSGNLDYLTMLVRKSNKNQVILDFINYKNDKNYMNKEMIIYDGNNISYTIKSLKSTRFVVRNLFVPYSLGVYVTMKPQDNTDRHILPITMENCVYNENIFYNYKVAKNGCVSANLD